MPARWFVPGRETPNLRPRAEAVSVLLPYSPVIRCRSVKVSYWLIMILGNLLDIDDWAVELGIIVDLEVKTTAGRGRFSRWAGCMRRFIVVPLDSWFSRSSVTDTRHSGRGSTVALDPSNAIGVSGTGLVGVLHWNVGRSSTSVAPSSGWINVGAPGSSSPSSAPVPVSQTTAARDRVRAMIR